MSYKIKFVDGARFMAASLSNLADNLVERIQKIKSKDCGCFLEYKLILLFRTSAYSYEYMDEWERFKKTSLPQKKKNFIAT